MLDVYAWRGRRGLGDPFPVARREIEEAADIVRGYRRLSPRDAIYAAARGHRLHRQGVRRLARVVRFDPLAGS